VDRVLAQREALIALIAIDAIDAINDKASRFTPGGLFHGLRTYFGAMRMAPSRRITSPFSMSLVTIWWTSLA